MRGSGATEYSRQPAASRKQDANFQAHITFYGDRHTSLLALKTQPAAPKAYLSLLLASNRGNVRNSNSTFTQAACHLHSLPAQALELILIVNLVHFTMADEDVLGAA